MSIKDAWKDSIPLRILLSIIGAALLAGMSGGVVLYAEVKTNTALLVDLQSDIHEVHKDLGERVRFLERNRRRTPLGSE